jgi:hypothetical protein
MFVALQSARIYSYLFCCYGIGLLTRSMCYLACPSVGVANCGCVHTAMYSCGVYTAALKCMTRIGLSHNCAVWHSQGGGVCAWRVHVAAPPLLRLCVPGGLCSGGPVRVLLHAAGRAGLQPYIAPPSSTL